MPDNELYNPTPERPKESCGLQGIESCESVFYQTETVCVPVSVTPFATPGIAKATCSGKPVISNKPCRAAKLPVPSAFPRSSVSRFLYPSVQLSKQALLWYSAVKFPKKAVNVTIINLKRKNTANVKTWMLNTEKPNKAVSTVFTAS